MTGNGSHRMIIIRHILDQVTVIDKKLVRQQNLDTVKQINLDSRKRQRENHKLTAS